MNKHLYLFFFIVIAAAFYAFERVSMFGTDLIGDIGASKTISIIVMFLFSIISLFLSKKPMANNQLSIRYSILMVYVYIISVIFAILFPFDTLILYLLIILPVILFSFSNRAYQYISNDRIIVGLMTIIFFLLAFNYINIYYYSDIYVTDYAYNASYQVLYLLPFVLCTKKVYLRVLGFIMAFFVVILSLKRGGFIAIIVASLLYVYLKLIVKKQKKITFASLIVILISIIGVYFLYDYLDGLFIDSRLYNRFLDETGSGRVELYQEFISLIKNSDSSHFLFGHGWRRSVQVSSVEKACHNDFLEVIFDFGLIGLILYVMFLISLIKLSVNMIRINHEYVPAMIVSLAIFLINSIVSSFITIPAYMMEMSFFWGFISSSYRNVSNNYSI